MTRLEYYELDIKNLEATNLKPSKQIQIEVLTKDTDHLLENATISSTNTDTYLVLFFDSILTYIDLRCKNIIFKFDFSKPELNMEFFTSPTNVLNNRLTNITAVVNSHHLVALNNSNDMLLLKLNINNSFRIIRSSCNDQEMKFSSFQMNKSYLIAFNHIKCKLIGYNIERLLDTNAFEKPQFQLDVINLNIYGFSIDFKHVFTVENQRLLKFYNFIEHRKMASIPLYTNVRCITCSSDYIVIGMKDKRIVSYMIWGSNDSYQKVKLLESR